MPDTQTIPGALDAPVVSLDAADMSFGPVHALRQATMAVAAGECVGLVGHNGAGKSTLANVINGRLSPTGGAVTHRYANIAMTNSENARNAGIRSVFQELSLCPNLTVLENLRIPYRNMPRRNWRRTAQQKVTDALDLVFPGHDIRPHATVGALTIAQRQMVEIAIAFADRDSEPSLVILDEPTSSLDAAIAQQLLAHINRFCAAGGAVLFISHMMGEIFEVATRIIIMKDGQIVDDQPARAFTRSSIVDAMGHVAPDHDEAVVDRANRPLGDAVIRAENGLSARKGEIVGLAGLAGHGQAEALAQIYFDHSPLWKTTKTPEVVFVAGDRSRDGVMPLWSILRNLSLTTLNEFSRRAMVDHGAEVGLVQSWKERIGIRTDNLRNSILSLSGGNQQKVLFARALASAAPIVLMDDPMRGVDVGTKKEVYQMLQDEAARGRSFLWYSTETDEILECDRVFVFRTSRIAAELIGEEITEENILRASFEMQEAAE
ncbi:sugar ABC transporter ATP-binding protein [Shimia sp. R9_1]|uniref:sugar ABC transporter ATP-binding protein n=1 Tax=Shimia sp. R9_1 TaxID=2821111 RepID=UPI001ADB651C|nr:sugar ABC transporter ATP-binding protein [Shimia sp. R9_1]MBO9409815.1 sugar ABC transporter ATP-binding protein [Shimia sp. R9_1]